MATVIEIVKAHLEAQGFDGLVQTDAACGCLLDDLQPCCGDLAPVSRAIEACTPTSLESGRSTARRLNRVPWHASRRPTFELTGKYWNAKHAGICPVERMVRRLLAA